MRNIIYKLRVVFDRKQKIKMLIIFALMVAGALLETLGVSLIVPLMTTVLNEDFYKTNRYAVYVCSLLDIHSAKTFIILMLLALIIVFIVKDAFLYFEYYVQQRFICNNKVRMQKRMMQQILNRPYEYFLGENTGNIMRIIVTDVQGTFLLLTHFMSFATEMVVCIIVMIAVFCVNATMAVLVSCILLIELLVINFYLKPILKKLGIDAQKIKSEKTKWIIQAVSGIKETKIGNKQDMFVNNYEKHATYEAVIDRKNTVIANAPRLIIEAVTISSLLGFVGIFLYMGNDVADVLPQLAAFAVAAVRILPSANRISTAVNSFSFYEANLNSLAENLTEMQGWEDENAPEAQEASGILKFEKGCCLNNISYHYPDTEEYVLENAGMDIPIGKSIGIVGTSGAGKTTAVDILLGLLKPQEGQVLSDGENIWSDYGLWLKKLSYIPQTIYLLDDTIASNVAYGCDKEDIDADLVWKVLEEAQMKAFVEKLPDGIYTQIGERGVRLSGGQRQRIGIARALYTNPELLILDEATSALDNETEAAIMEAINSLRGKKTLVIIAHRLTTIEGCDMIYRVQDKKIVRER